MFKFFSFITIAIAALVSLSLSLQVSAHGALVAINGANGITIPGIGIDESTPRDGTRRNPFQQDTSIIRDKEIADGTAGVCGRTLQSGTNDVEAAVTEMGGDELPAMSANGTLSLTIHQVNGDGAGPYEAEISADATGSDFVQATVLQNVPGTRSRSRARAQDFAMTVQVPAGMNCTGGPNGNACLVRVRNSARAGPFGGCGAFTTAEAAKRDFQADLPGLGQRDETGENNHRKRFFNSRVVGRANAGKAMM